MAMFVKYDSDIIRVMMSTRFHELKAANGTAAESVEKMYPFQPEEVSSVYLHKRGVGAGVWFRLKDGRVYDSHGQPSERRPTLYRRMA
jgi:hypothetical protein